MVLDLHVPSLLSFRPGQWVDFVVPPHQWIGGFSIASSPRDIPYMRLAVKRSDHPPATWVHDHSKVHDTVNVSVGGNCTLEDEHDGARMFECHPAVFCAGGIGISPILSQYREFLYQRDKYLKAISGKASAAAATTTLFLYSVSTPDELVFGKELVKLSRPGSSRPSEGLDRMIFTLTRTNDGSSWDNSEEAYGSDAARHMERRTGRQMMEILEQAPKDAVFYICGPPSMIDEAVLHLEQKGVPSERIKFEKWW